MASATEEAEDRRSSASVDEEEELRWAAIQRLPTYDRVRKGMLREMLENGRVVYEEVDVRKMGLEERKRVMERAVKVVEEDNEKFLRRMRNRIDRVGIEIPKIEVRFENLSVEGDVYVGSRAQPNLLNLTLIAFESLLELIGLSQSKKKKIQILKDASGIMKPSRQLNVSRPTLTHSRTAISMDEDDKQGKNSGSATQHKLAGIDSGVTKSSEIVADSDLKERRGMVLPFQPLSLTFNHVNYYVDMPTEMKMNGAEENRLQLLRDVSGTFQPGILSALVGVSGAGKTTLMDVLAGRKTRGYIEGSIHISGYPKKQSTFARVSGYCEQNDIHSPYVTVYESLLYSASLRLSSDVDPKTKKMFVEEVMELVELDSIRDTIVGLPGVDGLSTEQRKRLTIAVELVANPSIIFMDEPTSGLDARSAAIVMRTVRNTVDTGRTVVCTIHQPSIDIFEAFDELLLMERGGQIIYSGPLGQQSCKLIEYLEAIPGIPKIEDGQNPATWMLEVTAPPMEAQLDINFAEIFAKSPLYRRNQELIMQLSTPTQGSEDLHFSNEYSQSFLSQCKACFWKHCHSYWRNTQYNAIRFLVTIFISFLFGLVFWNTGQNFAKEQDVLNIMGVIYATALFLGIFNSATVIPVVDTERVVFYRERVAGGN
ncbi:hypothetical protein Csa_001391 [Cucumis sativus]|nr:hypothetical protein Csa_001391 [Cucumis sativus]